MQAPTPPPLPILYSPFLSCCFQAVALVAVCIACNSNTIEPLQPVRVSGLAVMHDCTYGRQCAVVRVSSGVCSTFSNPSQLKLAKAPYKYNRVNINNQSCDMRGCGEVDMKLTQRHQDIR